MYIAQRRFHLTVALSLASGKHRFFWGGAAVIILFENSGVD